MNEVIWLAVFTGVALAGLLITLWPSARDRKRKCRAEIETRHGKWVIETNDPLELIKIVNKLRADDAAHKIDPWEGVR